MRAVSTWMAAGLRARSPEITGFSPAIKRPWSLLTKVLNQPFTPIVMRRRYPGSKKDYVPKPPSSPRPRCAQVTLAGGRSLGFTSNAQKIVLFPFPSSGRAGKGTRVPRSSQWRPAIPLSCLRLKCWRTISIDLPIEKAAGKLQTFSYIADYTY